MTHRQVLQLLWRYARQHLPMLALMVAILLLSTGLNLVKPFLYREAVDAIAAGGRGDAGVLRYALTMILWGALLGIGVLTLREVSGILLGWVELQVMRSAHADVFARVQRLPTHFHVNAFAGATARKIGRGTDALEDMMDRIWFNFLPLLILAAGYAVVFAFFAPILGVVMVGGIVVYAAVSIALGLLQARYHSWADRQDTRVTGSLVDAIAGYAAVKAFSAESREDDRHRGVFAELLRRLWVTWRLGTFVTWVQFLLITAIELALLLLGAVLWSRGEFTVGSFIVVFSYIGGLWGHLFDIGQQVRNYLRAAAHAEEMVGLALAPLGVEDGSGAPDLRVTRGAITFEAVTFHYPEHAGGLATGGERSRGRKPVFDRFSLTIRAGEKVALVGHSGGGKSTFVKLLLRLYDVQGGKILVDGQNVADITQESLRRNIALVPQDPVLFHRSLSENISYARPGATRAEIERAAKLAHAHDFIAALPHGYDTLVGERGVKLSGGERQRVAIARAILADTPVLILDEATSSLDSLSEQYIQEAMAFLMRGRTTIVIAHRLSTIKKVDRILVIEGGKIREEGRHADLVKKEAGIYRGFFELQAGGFIGE